MLILTIACGVSLATVRQWGDLMVPLLFVAALLLIPLFVYTFTDRIAEALLIPAGILLTIECVGVYRLWQLDQVEAAGSLAAIGFVWTGIWVKSGYAYQWRSSNESWPPESLSRQEDSPANPK